MNKTIDWSARARSLPQDKETHSVALSVRVSQSDRQVVEDVALGMGYSLAGAVRHILRAYDDMRTEWSKTADG